MWIKLEGIRLSEINQSERKLPCDLIYMWSLKKQNAQKQRVDWWLPEARKGVGGRGEGSKSSSGLSEFWGWEEQPGGCSSHFIHVFKVAKRVNFTSSQQAHKQRRTAELRDIAAILLQYTCV